MSWKGNNADLVPPPPGVYKPFDSSLFSVILGVLVSDRSSFTSLWGTWKCANGEYISGYCQLGLGMSAINTNEGSLGEGQKFYLSYNTINKEVPVPVLMEPPMRWSHKVPNPLP